jgi:transcriptional regulator with XRE-family HTH domain
MVVSYLTDISDPTRDLHAGATPELRDGAGAAVPPLAREVGPAYAAPLSVSGELGPALRAWRERLTPEGAGVPATGPRRTPGLRRRELAILAGVSPDYITQLEQGRASTPSAQVLIALSRTLQLSETEQEHLFRLARQPAPSNQRPGASLPAEVMRLINQLEASPAAVYDALWSPVTWNPLWSAVHGDVQSRPNAERNLVWRTFNDLGTRLVRTNSDTAAFEERLVGDLRLTSSRYQRDPGLTSLLDDLTQRSRRFRRLWDSRSVDVYDNERKTIKHPSVGTITVTCNVLLTRRSDLRVIVYTPETGTSLGRLKELRAAITDA